MGLEKNSFCDSGSTSLDLPFVELELTSLRESECNQKHHNFSTAG